MKLQRYNEVLLAVLGTGALLFAIIEVATSFWPRQPAGQEGVQVGPLPGANRPQKQALEFCEPHAVAGTAFEYFPVAVVDQADAARDPHLSGSTYGLAVRVVGDDYYPQPGCQGGSSRRVTNIVIQDRSRNLERLLLEKPGLVDSILLPSARCGEGEGPVPCGVALWMLRSEDSNGDGRLSAQDVRSTWASDLDGGNLRRLTPEGQSTEDVHWLPQGDRMVIRVRPDSNGNGIYTDEDGVRLLATRATMPAMATELMGAATMEALLRAIQ